MKKILIVEDNIRNRVLLKDILTFEGYEVIEAATGFDGIRMAEEFNPDLIFMDIQMPVMDGLTAFKNIRSSPKTSLIKVVALTSFAMKGDQEKFLEAGFDDYMSKPIDPDYIPEMVRKLVG